MDSHAFSFFTFFTICGMWITYNICSVWINFFAFSRFFENDYNNVIVALKSPSILFITWFVCNFKIIILISPHFFRISLIANVSIGLLPSSQFSKETILRRFFFSLYSSSVVFLPASDYQIPLRSLQCYLHSPQISNSCLNFIPNFKNSYPSS